MLLQLLSYTRCLTLLWLLSEPLLKAAVLALLLKLRSY